MGFQKLLCAVPSGVLAVCLPLGTAVAWQQDWGQAPLLQDGGTAPSASAWGYATQGSGGKQNQAPDPAAAWPGRGYDYQGQPQNPAATDFPSYGYGDAPLDPWAQPAYQASPTQAPAGQRAEQTYGGAGQRFPEVADFDPYPAAAQGRFPAHRFRPWSEEQSQSQGGRAVGSGSPAPWNSGGGDRSWGYLERGAAHTASGAYVQQERSADWAGSDNKQGGAGSLLWYAPGASAPTRFRFRPLSNEEQALQSRPQQGSGGFASPTSPAPEGVWGPGFDGQYPSVGYENPGYSVPRNDPFRPRSRR